jgi:hypothetical protein
VPKNNFEKLQCLEKHNAQKQRQEMTKLEKE